MSTAQKRATECKQLSEKVKQLTAIRNDMQAEISRLKADQDNAFRVAERTAKASVKALILRLEDERDTAVRNAHDYHDSLDRTTAVLIELQKLHDVLNAEMEELRSAYNVSRAEAFKYRGLAKNAANLVLKSVIPMLQRMCEDVMEDLHEELKVKCEGAAT